MGRARRGVFVYSAIISPEGGFAEGCKAPYEIDRELSNPVFAGRRRRVRRCRFQFVLPPAEGAAGRHGSTALPEELKTPPWRLILAEGICRERQQRAYRLPLDEYRCCAGRISVAAQR
jgi:hypothetical protein